MKKVIVTTVMLLATVVVMANPIERTAALQKAQELMKNINPQAQLQMGTAPRKMMSYNGSGSSPAYYIFNAENNQGFVIVSGDDRSEEILGYSDKGYLDVDNLPDALQFMLDTFESDLKTLDEQGYTEKPVDEQVAGNSRRKAMSIAREPIAPLIKTFWTQSSPFVDQMTEDVVGCQRIAAGQLLYYWGCDKTLATITGVPTSISSTGKYEPQTFDMTKILSHYRNDGGTEEERAEVARYISCVRYSLGTGVHTDLVSKGPKYWGVTPGAVLYRRNCFPNDFERIVYQELSQGAPVYVGGHCQTTTPNHFFIIDGYSYDDFFHINWGWEGVCDGYFRLAPLNAYNWSTAANWSQTFEALIGFRGPGLTAESTAQPSDVASLGLVTFSFANSSNTIVYDDQTINRDGSLKIRTYLENWSNNFNSSEQRTFDLELVAYDMNNNKVKTIATKQATFTQATPKAVVWNLSNIDLPVGEYQLVSKSKDATYKGESHFDYVKGVYSHAKLVVEDNQITASLVKAMTIDSYEFIGKKKPGYRTAIKFSATNNSFNKLTWNFSLYLGSVSADTQHDSDEFRLQAKSSGEFVLEFEAGEEASTLYLYNKDRGDRGLASPIYAEIPFDPSSFTASTATNSNLSFTWNLSNSSGSSKGGYIYGSELDGTVKITNSSYSATYEDLVTIQIYYGRASYNNRYKSANITVPLKLAPRASTTIDLSGFNYSDGAFDGEKQLAFFVYDGSYRVDEDNSYYTYAYWYVRSSVNYWDKNGKLSYTTSVSSSAPSAAAVSYRGMSVSRTIYPNSNPNCIYYFDTETQAKRLSNYQNYNVVVGDQAYTDIKFTDDSSNGIYVPFTFKAANVTYERTLTNAYTEDSENAMWSTICLPYDVQNVTVGNESVEIGEGVELRKFYGEEFSTVYFDASYQMKANQPYLIRVAEENVNKQMTFASTNVDIIAGVAMSDANNYNFVNNYTAAKTEKNKFKYVLDSNGNSFNNATNPTYTPFRGYMTSEVKNGDNVAIVDRSVKLVKGDHRYPAIEFTYNGVNYVVPAWDELVAGDVTNTRLQAIEKIQEDQTNVAARTVTSRAWSVDGTTFEPFLAEMGNITIDGTVVSVSTLTYGDACDLLNLYISSNDRDVKVFDFHTPSTATEFTVPTQLIVTEGTNAGHTFNIQEIGAGTYYNYNYSDVKTINIPAGIEIKNMAFGGFSSLNKIVFESGEPPVLSGDPFTNVTKNMCAVYVPAQSVKTYRESNELWNEFIFATPVSTTKKFVSFSSNVPFTTRQFNGIRWTSPSTIWMYWADKSKNNSSTSLTISPTRDLETKLIPAGFGLIIKTTSSGGSGYTFMPPVGASEKTDLIADNNLLKGVTVKTQMADIVAANPDNNYYILTDNMFKRVYSGNLAAGLAYLEMPSSIMNSGDSSAKIVISLEDDATDGIILINGDEQNGGSVYDIQGRKVENMSKGIYIVNGKKVVIK
ncbi:MAG: C10 family peptidase [Prevotella sp.]|nr:C10 family peptidase [Prevotella sp.]